MLRTEDISVRWASVWDKSDSVNSPQGQAYFTNKNHRICECSDFFSSGIDASGLAGKLGSAFVGGHHVTGRMYSRFEMVSECSGGLVWVGGKDFL